MLTCKAIHRLTEDTWKSLIKILHCKIIFLGHRGVTTFLTPTIKSLGRIKLRKVNSKIPYIPGQADKWQRSEQH